MVDRKNDPGSAPDPHLHVVARSGSEEALPLPKFLMRIYYIFPIILYLPDVIFNFYVYSNGLLKTTQFPDVLFNVEFYLWAFLATGIVGMAWLLSVLAPWHWVRGNHFQAVMCWFGVIIATAITTWNSMSFRFDQKTTPFPTDLWFSQIFHVNLTGFSPTTVLVSVSPPFWGLFWAIVQPAERRRNASEQAEEFELKKLRMQQESELKKMRAEANAQVRGAQLAGLAASMKAARTQIGAAMTNKDDDGSSSTVTVTTEPTDTATSADSLAELPNASAQDQVDTVPSSGAPGANGSSDGEGSQDDQPLPLPAGNAFVELVRQAVQQITATSGTPNANTISVYLQRAGYMAPKPLDVVRALTVVRAAQEVKAPARPLPAVDSAEYNAIVATAARTVRSRPDPLTVPNVIAAIQAMGYVAPTFPDISDKLNELSNQQAGAGGGGRNRRGDRR